MMVIEDIVNDNYGPVVITQRYPADIVITMIPVNPGWSPEPGWNPVPARMYAPVPAAIMAGNPAPWLIREPGPAGSDQPDPAAVVVWSPVTVNSSGHPDAAVGRNISPFTVHFQLVAEIVQLLW